jgi:hypothetical protein
MWIKTSLLKSTWRTGNPHSIKSANLIIGRKTGQFRKEKEKAYG